MLIITIALLLFKLPAIQHNINEAVDKLPAVQHNINEAADKLPAVQHGAADKLPAVQHNIDKAVDKLPAVQHNINEAADKLPAVQHNINEAADKLPAVQHGAADKLPAVQHNINEAADKLPTVQHNINEAVDKLPAVQHNIDEAADTPPYVQHGAADRFHKTREKNLPKVIEHLKVDQRRSPKEIFNHSYFSPRDKIVETYNNSVLLQPKSGCEDSQQVHFIVASSPGDVNTRAAIRETWGSVARDLPWPGKNLSLSVRLTFILGVTNKTNSSLYPQDKEQWDDILQFDMIDSYQNFTRKILLAMQWVVSSCNNVQYIVKVDQDNMANVPLLVSFLKHRGKNNSIYGYMLGPGDVLRGDKWEVSTKAYPPTRYPVWASGTAYVMSRSAAETVLKLCPYYSYVPIEDAFITGVLASIGSIDRFHISGFTHHASPTPTACSFIKDDILFGNLIDESELRNIWRKMVAAAEKGNRC